jgi:hypothetical protein
VSYVAIRSSSVVTVNHRRLSLTDLSAYTRRVFDAPEKDEEREHLGRARLIQ